MTRKLKLMIRLFTKIIDIIRSITNKPSSTTRQDILLYKSAKTLPNYQSILNNYKEDVANLRSLSISPKNLSHASHLYYSIASGYSAIAVLEMQVNQNYIESLRGFYLAAIAGHNETRAREQLEGWPNEDINYIHICYAILSGNRNALDLFLRKEYPIKDYREQWLHSSIVTCIKSIIEDDFETLADCVAYFKSGIFKRWKSFLPFGDFFEAVLLKDEGKCNEALKSLLKTRRYRENNDLLIKLFSIDTCAMAKLAAYKGINVTVKSPVIPIGILAIVGEDANNG